MSIHRTTVQMLAVATACTPLCAQFTVRASVDSKGYEANLESGLTSLSADGRYVVFASSATNLAPLDGNGTIDVFVRDRTTATTELISIALSGRAGDDLSTAGDISADGRFVAFQSRAIDLTPDWDTFGDTDIFVRDRLTGTTDRITKPKTSAHSADSVSPQISGDASTIVFESWARLVPNDSDSELDLYLYDRATGVIALVVASGVPCLSPSISADGRTLTFVSAASTLVPGDTNGVADTFLMDRTTGSIVRVSVDSNGVQGDGLTALADLSADGRTVALWSWASNLVPGDTNGQEDIFVHDTVAHTTSRVSVDSFGGQSNSYSERPAISGDGRRVAFASFASNLVPGDVNGFMDIFVHDRQTGVTELASCNSWGVPAKDDESYAASISEDGLVIGFSSSATNLVPGAGSHGPGAYARVLSTCDPSITTYCTAKVNSLGCLPRIVATGIPSGSAVSGFVIAAEQVAPGEPGVLLYSYHGLASAPFQGGFLCAAAPLKRSPVQFASSGGVPPCSGAYALDFNARIASGIDPSLVVGQRVWAQYWMRDSGSDPATGLTDAVTFVVCQ
ncbi:MAG: PD40 domain-containing protein [Planctomycetes bacterium]|nr:PD40 domain-containing protein [Planctomycetota bacterium]